MGSFLSGVGSFFAAFNAFWTKLNGWAKWAIVLVLVGASIYLVAFTRGCNRGIRMEEQKQERIERRQWRWFGWRRGQKTEEVKEKLEKDSEEVNGDEMTPDEMESTATSGVRQ